MTLPAIVVVLAGAAGLWWWLGRDAPAEAPVAAGTTLPANQAPPSADLPTVPAGEPEVTDALPASDAGADEVDTDGTGVGADARQPDAAAVAEAASGMVTAASVCETFAARGAEWQCEAIGDRVAAGRNLVFYTRVRSPRAMSIEHRWFNGDTLHQRVDLAIGANSGAGYRTYSRATVGPGTWRVQLRANDVVLHEVSFRVP